MFRVKYIEDRVRETLNIQERELTARDLRKITGILINDSGEYEIPIVWYMDSSAHQMHQPNLVLWYHEFMNKDGWESDMLLFKHIQSFYYLSMFTTLSFSKFIGSFKKLTDLQLVNIIMQDWSFIEKMNDLHMVSLHSCGGDLCSKNDTYYGNKILGHLGKLYAKQVKRAEQYKNKLIKEGKDNITELLFNAPYCLDYISFVKMGITDLSPFMNIKRLTELNLSWNEIKNVEPLKSTTAYCLSLRHNSISDISKLNISATYMLNLRWNDLQTIKPILNKIKRIKKNTGLFEKRLARLYLGNNAIPDDELSALLNYDFVDNDFREAAATNIIDLPDDIVINRDDMWLIEKITDKDGNQKLDGHYADWTGSTATDLRVGLKVGMVLIKNNQGNTMTDWAMSTSVVDDIELKDDLLTITTAYSIYYLKKVQVEDK